MQGLRATTRGGHIAVFDAVRAQFNSRGGMQVFGRLHAMHRRRNRTEYPDEDSPGVDEHDAQQALNTTQAVKSGFSTADAWTSSNRRACRHCCRVGVTRSAVIPLWDSGAMARRKSPSARSRRLARGGRAALRSGVKAARQLGAVTGDDPAVREPAPAPAGRFDPALDLPLGIEPVGSVPRTLELRETDPPFDVLPRSAVVQAADAAAVGAAREIGLPVSSVGYWIMGPQRGRGAARFSDRKHKPPSLHPPYVSVDLTGGHTRDQVVASLVRAVMKASRARRRPQELPGFFVDPEREARWPELRSQPRRADGLKQRLHTAAESVPAGRHVGRWFVDVGRAVHLEAFDSGVPVILSGDGANDAGFQASWTISTDDPIVPSINLSTAEGSLDDVIGRVVDLVLFAHGVDPDSEQALTVERAMRAAATARLTAMPEAPPL